MLKVYEWLVYIIMRPHKSFQHLIKWFGIFIRAKTNYRKRKERLNREKKKKAYLSPGARPTSPAGPAHPNSPVVFHPALPSSSVARRRRRGRHLDAQDVPGRPVPSYVVLENRREAVLRFPLLSRALPSSPRFPLLPRERPPFVVDENRSQRRREA